MPPDGELEATQMAQIEADLTELSAHVNRWINDRFLSSESAEALKLEDVAGLITWLQQWHIHFDSYGDTATELDGDGRPAMKARLAQIRTEIDASITSFTQMMAGLLPNQET